MSLQYIRNYYDIPAHKGQAILFGGKRMKITGASGPHLKAKDESGRVHILHPTWEVTYLEETYIKGEQR
jgi:hypothetical protein